MVFSGVGTSEAAVDQLLAGQGLGEEEPLRALAARLGEPGGGGRRLHAFSGDTASQPVGKADDRPDDGSVSIVWLQVREERPVDLQLRDGQRAQLRQAGIALAEIIDGDGDPLSGHAPTARAAATASAARAVSVISMLR